jgi:hypothetical protein
MKKQNIKNNSFDKEVSELSSYIEKEKERDFIEDMEDLIKDYGYTKCKVITLLKQSKK